jgi:dTDP-4-dehydrorhamnose 3,5-epimerase
MASRAFENGPINDLIWRPLKRYDDARGWLCEFFRHDDLAEQYHPTMGYISLTLPGVARGPHEHVDQADLFCFVGPGEFKVFLWDNRPASPTYWRRQTEIVGMQNPMALIVPAGIAHAYKNVGTEPAIVYNFPNRLYRGPGRNAAVDEIRHEVDPATPFKLD